MSYYFLIKETKIIGVGQCSCQSEGCICIEVTQEQYNLAQEKGNDYFLYANNEIILNPDYDIKKLEQAKQAKYSENETIRDAFLVEGVEYKEILWDSDLEQKLNISVQVSTMGDDDTVVWVAKDGVTSLECSKADLLAIGQLLTTMTAYVWQIKNPQIKTAIANATTIEEVEAIEIEYSLDEMTNADTTNE